MDKRIDKNKKNIKIAKKALKEQKKQEKIETKTRNEKRKEEQKLKNKRKRKIMLIILITIILLAGIYARFIEPNFLKVNEIKLETDKITENNHGLKIVHFSDLHYNSTINKSNIDKIINKINLLKPDLLFFTGDLFEQTVITTKEDAEVLTKAFNNLEATLGKYAVIGNHDIHNDYFANVLYDSGFTVLKNDYDLIYNKDNTPILVYGVDELLFGEPEIKGIDEYKDSDIYKILLLHEPDYIDEVEFNFDIALSGHSHNGQVRIPFVYKLTLPEGSRNYYKPYYQVNDTDLYISEGIGCSLLNFRLFTPPSINLYRLNKK